MSVHLLKNVPGKCLACDVEFVDVVASFADTVAWSLHHERCDTSRVAVGSIDDVKFIPAGSAEDPHPGVGRPARY
jgi:predicted amidohydrolase